MEQSFSPSALRGNQLPVDRHEAVLGSVRAIIEQQHDILEREDTIRPSQHDPIGVEVITERIGKRTDLADAEKGIKPGEVTLVWYDEDKIEELTQEVQGMQLFELADAKVLGHLAFARGGEKNDAKTGGAFYFLDDQRIFVQVEGTVQTEDLEESLPVDTKACYRLLKQLGVGDFWVEQFLLDESDDLRNEPLVPVVRAEHIGALNNVEAYTLEQFLNSYLPPDRYEAH